MEMSPRLVAAYVNADAELEAIDRPEAALVAGFVHLSEAMRARVMNTWALIARGEPVTPEALGEPVVPKADLSKWIQQHASPGGRRG
jgi:hypothetical protein